MTPERLLPVAAEAVLVPEVDEPLDWEDVAFPEEEEEVPETDDVVDEEDDAEVA